MGQNSLYKIFSDKLNDLQQEISKLKLNYSEPKQLPFYEYIWVLFSANIYYKALDLLTLIKKHKKKSLKIKAPINIIFRSILEDYIFLKYLTINPFDAKRNVESLLMFSEGKNKTHLTKISDLIDSGLYIPPENQEHVLSKTGIVKKLSELDKVIQEYATPSTVKIADKLKNIEEMCKDYDIQLGITSVVAGQEYLSLRWIYNIIYRFSSGYIHQVLNQKEAIIDVLWKGESYSDNHEEILSTLILLIENIISLSPTNRELS